MLTKTEQNLVAVACNGKPHCRWMNLQAVTSNTACLPSCAAFYRPRKSLLWVMVLLTMPRVKFARSITRRQSAIDREHP